MAASIVPALIDALVTTAVSALPAAVVIDGQGHTDDPGDYLLVGCEEPDADGESEAADVTQEQVAFGSTRPRQEDGVIHMVARSVNGDANQKAARDAVYAIQEALATALRTTDDLGVTGGLMLSNGSDLTLGEDQSEFGAVATLRYDIAFKSVI